MYQVSFRFEKGEDRKIFAAENENLLEVARKANVAIERPRGRNQLYQRLRQRRDRHG